MGALEPRPTLTSGIAVVVLIARHHMASGVVLACVIAANLAAAAAWRQG